MAKIDDAALNEAVRKKLSTDEGMTKLMNGLFGQGNWIYHSKDELWIGEDDKHSAPGRSFYCIERGGNCFKRCIPEGDSVGALLAESFDKMVADHENWQQRKMPESIPVIQTIYRGIKYRSRTEARWAVFLKTLGLKFHYEFECYDLPVVGPYLPDFFIPDERLFIEVKGLEPIAIELERCKHLSQITNCRVLIVSGPPSEKLYPLFSCSQEYWGEGLSYARIEKCRRCDGLILAMFQDRDGLDIYGADLLGHHLDPDRCSDKSDGAGVPQDALNAALTERFGIYD